MIDAKKPDGLNCTDEEWAAWGGVRSCPGEPTYLSGQAPGYPRPAPDPDDGGGA